MLSIVRTAAMIWHNHMLSARRSRSAAVSLGQSHVAQTSLRIHDQHVFYILHEQAIHINENLICPNRNVVSIVVSCI